MWDADQREPAAPRSPTRTPRTTVSSSRSRRRRRLPRRLRLPRRPRSRPIPPRRPRTLRRCPTTSGGTRRHSRPARTATCGSSVRGGGSAGRRTANDELRREDRLTGNAVGVGCFLKDDAQRRSPDHPAGLTDGGERHGRCGGEDGVVEPDETGPMCTGRPADISTACSATIRCIDSASTSCSVSNVWNSGVVLNAIPSRSAGRRWLSRLSSVKCDRTPPMTDAAIPVRVGRSCRRHGHGIAHVQHRIERHHASNVSAERVPPRPPRAGWRTRRSQVSRRAGARLPPRARVRRAGRRGEIQLDDAKSSVRAWGTDPALSKPPRRSPGRGRPHARPVNRRGRTKGRKECRRALGCARGPGCAGDSRHR